MSQAHAVFKNVVILCHEFEKIPFILLWERKQEYDSNLLTLFCSLIGQQGKSRKMVSQ